MSFDGDVFRVIIAGSREFNDYQLLCLTMDKLLVNIKVPIVVVCGMARGADSLGKRYAEEKGFYVDEHPANWRKFGKAAGYIRNEEMAMNADALVAFWDGKSRGTEHMINLANKHGLMVRIKRYDRKPGDPS